MIKHYEQTQVGYLIIVVMAAYRALQLMKRDSFKNYKEPIESIPSIDIFTRRQT